MCHALVLFLFFFLLVCLLRLSASAFSVSRTDSGRRHCVGAAGQLRARNDDGIWRERTTCRAARARSRTAQVCSWRFLQVTLGDLVADARAPLITADTDWEAQLKVRPEALRKCGAADAHRKAVLEANAVLLHESLWVWRDWGTKHSQLSGDTLAAVFTRAFCSYRQIMLELFSDQRELKKSAVFALVAVRRTNNAEQRALLNKPNPSLFFLSSVFFFWRKESRHGTHVE